MSDASENTACGGRNWLYVLAGAALVAAGIALLSRLEARHEEGEDPVEDAMRLLARAQNKISEIEEGFRSARPAQPA